MQSKLHRNVVYHGIEVLFLVSMFFLLAIPMSLLILKELLCSSSYSPSHRVLQAPNIAKVAHMHHQQEHTEQNVGKPQQITQKLSPRSQLAILVLALH